MTYNIEIKRFDFEGDEVVGGRTRTKASHDDKPYPIILDNVQKKIQ